MIHRIFHALALVALLPAVGLGQGFTSQEQEVIDHTKRCWKLWGLEENPALWEQECPADPDMRFWWTAQSVPVHGTAEWKAWSEVFHPRINEIFHAHRPIAVQFFGDVVLYYYWATWSWEDANGQVQTAEQHRFDVYQRRNDQLWWIGGTGTQTATGGVN